MIDATKPKFVHVFAGKLVDSRKKRAFLGSPYVEATDLLGIQSMLFEMCAILGIRFNTQSLVFFRVLFSHDANGNADFDRAEEMFTRSVSAHLGDAHNPVDLIFRSNCQNLGFYGDFNEYLNRFGKERLPVDKSKGSVAAWGMKGGIAGFVDPEATKALLKRSYSTWQERGFPQEFATILDSPFGDTSGELDELMRDTTKVFEEFCLEFYPNEAKELLLAS